MENESDHNITTPTGIKLFKKLMKQESGDKEKTMAKQRSEEEQDEFFIAHLKSLATRTKKKLKK